MGKANYADKVKLKESGLPAINSWRDVDANEVKAAINDNDDRITDLEDVGVPTSDDVSVNTTPFNKNLSSADTDVQKALETIDQMEGGTGGGGTALSTTTDTTSFNKNLSASDTDVQKALQTFNDADLGGGSGGSETHIQTTPSTAWDITHTLDTEDLNFEVYDDTNNVIIPENIKVNSVTSVTVTFPTVKSGRVVLLSGGGSQSASADPYFDEVLGSLIPDGEVYRTPTSAEVSDGLGYGNWLSTTVFNGLPEQSYYVRMPNSTTSLLTRIALICYNSVMDKIAVVESSEISNDWNTGTFDEFDNPIYIKIQNADGYYMNMGLITTPVDTAFIQIYTNGKVLETTDMCSMSSESFELNGDPVDYIKIKHQYEEQTIKNLSVNPTLLEGLTENAESFLPASTFSPLYGKVWYAIGDSNTQWHGGEDVDNPDDNGFLTLAARANGCTFVNAGYAGAKWEIEIADPDRDPFQGVGRVDQLIIDKATVSYDIITIALGTNVSDAGLVTDTSANVNTMCGAARYCLERLLVNFPSTPIGVVLGYQRQDGNTQQLDRNNQLKEICDYYSIPVLDLYNAGQVIWDSKIAIASTNVDDAAILADMNLLGDGLHLHDNGIINSGRKYGQWIKTL